MRIWDVSPSILCRKHLLGEHRELHAIWDILFDDTSGSRMHTETQRWVSKLAALRIRHEKLVEEMTKRGYNHQTPLPPAPDENTIQDVFLLTPEEQLEDLTSRRCDCPLGS